MLVVSISGHSADDKAPEIVILVTWVTAIDEELFPRELRTMESMPFEEQMDSGTIERLKSQADFLLRIYRAELANDPTSHAAESARSNVIALRHTIEQIHGRAR